MAIPRFARTTSGKIAQYRFHSKPLVWLEGDTDYPMYSVLTQDMNCDLRAAGGFPECHKLVRAMIEYDLPYVVILDGDYRILRRKRSYHRRAILLKRYSIENYLAEPASVESICKRYSEGKVLDCLRTRFAELLEQLEKNLRELVVLDIANAETREKVLPGSVLSVLAKRTPPAFDEKKIKALVKKLEQRSPDERMKTNAQDLLDQFLARKRFVDILKGHWVFELIRWFMNGELKQVKIGMYVDNKGLRTMLAAEMWRNKRSKDHLSLRRSLQRAVREVKKMRGWL